LMGGHLYISRGLRDAGVPTLEPWKVVHFNMVAYCDNS
jgi:hypothetical protein